MPTRRSATGTLEVDDQGYLVHSSDWTPDLADELAADEGITLTDEHWSVIAFCREDAAREGRPPGLRRIAKLSGTSIETLRRLFPNGPGRLAAKIAGLPEPKSCV